MKNFRLFRGFGLIEILVAVFIVTFGVVAVGVLQSNIMTTSSENQGRQIARQIAQSRLENLRNYSQEYLDQNIESQTELLSSLIDKTYPDGISIKSFITDKGGNIALSNLTSSVFEYSFIDTVNQIEDGIDLRVEVFWIDRSNNKQSVVLSSEVSFSEPAMAATNSPPPPPGGYIEAPTGRARIGDGTLTDADKLNKMGGDNIDGTAIYGDASNTGKDSADLLLAVGDDVVLTLEDACILTTGDPDLELGDGDYRCTDFVRISGRVYFDDSLQINSNGNKGVGDINADDFFVLASDAAYCSRFYPESFALSSDGNSVSYSSAQTSMSSEGYSSVKIDKLPYELYTSSSDSGSTYSGKLYFYDYICYIGGGWHGNIGLLLAAEWSVDGAWAACVGDPRDSSITETNDNVEYAFKRSYRGMVWKRDENGSPIKVSSDASAPTRYYSWGVADASEIGGNEEYNHDFLVVESSDRCFDTTNDPVMVKEVFATNADDFFCLNEVATNAKGLVDPDTTGYDFSETEYTPASLANRTNLDERPLDSDRNGSYINTIQIGYESKCDYDPTNPPYFVHTGTGKLYLNGSQITDVSKETLLGSFFLKTSQGNNCTLAALSGYDATNNRYIYDYSCDLYDFGKKSNTDDVVENGFRGALYAFDLDINDDYIISCPYAGNLENYDFTNLNTNTLGPMGWVDSNVSCDLSLQETTDSGFLIGGVENKIVLTPVNNTVTTYDITTFDIRIDDVQISNMGSIASVSFIGNPSTIDYPSPSEIIPPGQAGQFFDYYAGGFTNGKSDETIKIVIVLKDGRTASGELFFDISR